MKLNAVTLVLFLPTASMADTTVAPSLGLRASVPLGGSASMALTVGENQATAKQGHHVVGPSFLAEAGTGGGQLGLGVAIVAEDHWWRPLVAAGIHAVVVRTWGSPWLTEKRQTYVGTQIQGTLWGAGLRLGALRHVHGAPPSRKWVVTVGAGWGF